MSKFLNAHYAVLIVLIKKMEEISDLDENIKNNAYYKVMTVVTVNSFRLKKTVFVVFLTRKEKET